MSRPRIVVFVSGSGSNLQAIIDAVAQGRLPIGITAVVSNRKVAYGLTRAENAGIDTLYFPLKPYLQQENGREAYDVALAERVKKLAPDLIVLAGWMHILTPAFLNHFAGKVINLHPALPGEFAGINAVERAFAAFTAGEIDRSGCMIHYAIPEVDAGPVLMSEEVPFLPADTLDSFAGRLHAAEHRIIVAAIGRHFGFVV